MRIRAAKLLATFFGCGLAPKAPGTVGSAAGLVIAIAAHTYFGMPWWGLLALTAICFLPAVWAADVTAKALKVQDPGCIVIDEVLGQWLALSVPCRRNWVCYLLAFGLFRLFDIWKPRPVRWFEKLPGGWGIIADDLMAGVYAALVLFAAGCFNLY